MQDKCPYCHTGTIMWIWYEEDDTYQLQCADCKAVGEFTKKEETKHTICEGCDDFLGECDGNWSCPGAY